MKRRKNNSKDPAPKPNAAGKSFQSPKKSPGTCLQAIAKGAPPAAVRKPGKIGNSPPAKKASETAPKEEQPSPESIAASVTEENRGSSSFPIIGIGASAGGLASFEK